MLLLNRNNVYRVLASTWTCPASTIIGMPINWQLSCKGVPPLVGRQSHNMYMLSIYDYFPCIVSWSSSKSLITVTTWNLDIPYKWFASIWFLIAWLVPHFHTLCKSELLPASRFVLFLVQLYCGFSPSF